MCLSLWGERDKSCVWGERNRDASQEGGDARENIGGVGVLWEEKTNMDETLTSASHLSQESRAENVGIVIGVEGKIIALERRRSSYL